jgi:hypothetical protein
MGKRPQKTMKLQRALPRDKQSFSFLFIQGLMFARDRPRLYQKLIQNLEVQQIVYYF